MTTNIIYDDTIEDRQRYFDKTVQHLLGATKRAYDTFDSGQEVCLYRTKDGGACAVGVHIPDDHPAASKVEPYKGAWSTLVVDFPDLIGVAIPLGWEGENLVADLQALHDTAINWNDEGLNGRGVRALRTVAASNHLSAAVLAGVERS